MTSSTLKMLSSATSSAERRGTSATGGLGSQHWNSACCTPTAQRKVLTHRQSSHALNASVVRNCMSHCRSVCKDVFINHQSFLTSYRCPPRECHGAFKCQGDFVDSYAIGTLEECIEKCNDNVDCQWFTLEKSNDHCILYEECNDHFDCET